MIDADPKPLPDTPTTTAFVVLRHDDRAGTHYDLMIDRGERLATWKCPQPPEAAIGLPVSCRRIGDHRRLYLDYEGPVSGDRGEVRRHDRGQCAIEKTSSSCWRLTFQSSERLGPLELVHMAGDDWQLRRPPPSPSSRTSS